jgi:hypothetical protein
LSGFAHWASDTGEDIGASLQFPLDLPRVAAVR